MKYCLAVDIGASSGKVMLGQLNSDRLLLREIHRFDNQLIYKNGHYCWDIQSLFQEIKTGLKKCQQLGISPSTIGIDTWAVDFVLLDENDQLITDAIAYRDPRTDGMMEKVLSIISKEKLYEITGIQFQKFNTIYQLYAVKEQDPEWLKRAQHFLMLPDYLHYLLTGVKVNEYTNATSTQLVNVLSQNWDHEIISKLGINQRIFGEIKQPQTILGTLQKELVEEFGFDMEVILPASHDTASAVISVPSTEDTIFISSGTWSLMGVVNDLPICSTEAMRMNFTNEGGINGQYRFLKNIMGLWMIEEVRRNFGHAYSYTDFMKMASQFPDFQSLVHVDDPRFLKPENMVEEIQAYCRETNQQVPIHPGEIAKCIYDSLVDCYENTVNELETILGREFKTIHVIGGGSQNHLLNQKLADKTRKEVYAGPIEATAIGNLLVQMLAIGEIDDVNKAKHIIKNSFELKTYFPAKEFKEER